MENDSSITDLVTVLSTSFLSFIICDFGSISFSHFAENTMLYRKMNHVNLILYLVKAANLSSPVA